MRVSINGRSIEFRSERELLAFFPEIDYPSIPTAKQSSPASQGSLQSSEPRIGRQVVVRTT